MKALELESISYSYSNGSNVLNNVNLSMEENESLALIGPNGIGKTTMLLLCNGILTPATGKVKIFGTELNNGNLKKIRREVGIVFQNPDDQLFAPTVFEDVAFGPLNQGLSHREIKERVDSALVAIGMKDFGERHPFTLSFGVKRKISIATILSMKPRILIFDEPTLGIDPWSKKDFLNLFKTLNRKHTTIYATHDPDIVKLCNRVVLVESGGKLRENGAGDKFRF